MGSAAMKVALVFPPLADATQPYSSLPALAGSLRSREHHEVMLHDANVEFVRHVLTGSCLDAAASRIANLLRRMEDDSEPYGRDADEYTRLISASLKAPVVSEDIDRALADITCRDTFLDLTRLDRAKRVIQDAIEVLSASYFPLTLGSFELSDRFSWDAPEIDRLAQDRNANPFLAFLEDVSLPRLESAALGAIGISITYRSQVLPAVTLALLVKRRMPHLPVIFGGNIASFWYDSLAACPEVFVWCDYLIAFEGESALNALLSALECGQPLDSVPNLSYRRGDCVYKGPLLVEDIDALPTPDYSGLPLDRYLAPQPVFLLNTSRGCYWSKCEFCSVSPSMRHRFRQKSPDLVLRDIRVLQARHSARCISFGDDCVPPRTLKALARGLRETGTEISWQCEVRFEAELTSTLLESLGRAGCRNLIFGLESYSPRVLRLMNKGVRHAEIQRILDDCRRHAIAFNLQLFFGFPGETEEEARVTKEFVTRQLHGAATLSFGDFKLQRGSGVARHPDAFGIRPHWQEPLAVNFAYDPIPEHSTEIGRKLRTEVLKRTKFHSLPLCIDGHTLIFLHEAGISAMASQYYSSVGASSKPSSKPRTSVLPGLEVKLVRRPRQTIADFRNWQDANARRILLYDYELDRAVELSRLAHWVVTEHLDQPRSASELIDQLVAATGDPLTRSLLTLSVNEILRELLFRGILVVAPQGDGIDGSAAWAAV
jgi:hypothetical protein